MKEGLGKRVAPAVAVAALLAAVSLVFALAPGATAAKRSSKLLTYAGNTSFGRPFVLQVRRGAVIRMAISWDASCVQSGVLAFGGILDRELGPPPESVGPDSGFLFFGGSLTRLGGFSGQGLGTMPVADADGAVEQTISGRVSSTRASGHWRVRVDVIDPDTSLADDSCKTSTFSWSAARSPGHAYGGYTNQDNPAVVQINKARSTVSAFRIAWTAPCGDDTNLTTSTTLTGLPLAGGKFGTTRTIDGVTGDDDTPVKFAVDLKGNATKSRATGTFQVTVTNPSSPTATCTSPTIEWNTASG